MIRNSFQRWLCSPFGTAVLVASAFWCPALVITAANAAPIGSPRLNTDTVTSSDFDGDGMSDLSTYDPSTGLFTTRSSRNGQISSGYASALGPRGYYSKVVVPADYNGDRITDLGMFDRQTGKWNVHGWDGEVQFGALGDIPVPGRYGLIYDRIDGIHFGNIITVNHTQNCADRAYYDQKNGRYSIRNCQFLDVITFNLGGPGFIPVPGDVDGDGLVDPGVFNPLTMEWRFIRSTSFYEDHRTLGLTAATVVPMTFTWGYRGHTPMMGEGGDADIALEPILYSSFPDPTGGFSIKTNPINYFWDTPLSSMGLVLDVGGGRGADYTSYLPFSRTFEIDTFPGEAHFSVPFPGGPGVERWEPSYVVPESFFTSVLNMFGQDYMAVIQYSNLFSEVNPTPPTETPAAPIPLPINMPVINSLRAIQGDFRRSGSSDVIVARSIRGLNLFFGVSQDNSMLSYYFGFPTDEIMTGDYDGDKRTEVNVVRNEGGLLYWYRRNNDATALRTQWGLAGDKLLKGDFDGDGIDDLGVVRAIGVGLYVYIKKSSGGEFPPIQFGLVGDTIWAADLNGDLRDELVAFRPAGYNWFSRSIDNPTVTTQQWGLPGDVPLPPADFDGDRRADLSVVRDHGNVKNVYIRFADATYTTMALFGTQTRDVPFVGFFSGSGRAEVGLFRQGESRKVNQITLQLFGNAPKIMSWGNGSDRFITPTGQAFGGVPFDDGDDTDTIGCDEIISPVDGAGRGFLWKPEGDGANVGKPVMLASPDYYWGADRVELVNILGQVADTCRITSVGFGFRTIIRCFGPRPAQLPRPLWARVTLQTGYRECYPIADPRRRYD